MLNSKAGHYADELGRWAEETFRSLLKNWFGSNISIVSDVPDHHGTDIRCIVTSKRGHLNQITINWQIKARTSPKINTGLFGEKAYVIDLKSAATIEHSLTSNDPIIVVLGIPNCEMKDRVYYPPIEHFNWYAVDLRQYIELRGDDFFNRKQKNVIIPFRNRLNLSIVSMLWSSLWVESEMLLLTRNLNAPTNAVINLSSVFTHPLQLPLPHGNIEADLKEVYTENYGYHKNIIKYHYGTGLATRDLSNFLNNQAYKKKEKDYYLSYANESISENINMLLFSRWMEQYLFEIIPKFYNHRYIRYFPLFTSEMNIIPPHIRCLLYHVLVLHRFIGAVAYLTTPLKEGTPTEHVLIEPFLSFHGNFVGHGQDWDYSKNQSRGSLDEERDIFSTIHQTKIIGTEQNDEDIMHLLNLRRNDIDLNLVPTFLFAKENLFIRHPRILFKKREVLY